MGDIVERLRDYDKCTVGPQEAADTIEALRAENARLREALKPFAEYAYVFDTLRDGCPDDMKFCSGLTYGDIRAARTAIGETK